MKTIVLLVLSFLCVQLDPIEAQSSSNTAEIEVYIFLHESCLVSQYYTIILRDLHDKYANEKLVFKGVFPNPNSTEEKMLAFQQKYHLPFAMLFDEQQRLTRKLGATITPEVVVFDVQQEEVLYRGRIDDAYYRVGKKRQVITTSELKDVLEAIAQGEMISVEPQPAIGCFIRMM